MTAPVRLTAVLTHPIQYYAPWFRHIQEHAPEIALTVVYATQPTPEQQGIGFERAFEWDVPLTGGYQSITVRAAEPGDRIDSSHFTGLDVPAIGGAIAATNPDVVMIPGWHSLTLVRALLTCRRLGIPTLYRGDSHLQSGPAGWTRPLWSLKTRLLLRQFDGYLSPGRRVDEYLAQVRRTRLPDLPDAARGRQRAVRDEPHRGFSRRRLAPRRAAPGASIPTPSCRCLPESWQARSIRWIVVRAAATLGPGVSVLVAGSGPLEAEMRAEAVAARRRSESDRVRESNRARSGVRHRRLSRAAERLRGNVGPRRQRSPRDRSASGSQRCRRLRARSASGRGERIHVFAW